jgi:hypothetical protein
MERKKRGHGRDKMRGKIGLMGQCGVGEKKNSSRREEWEMRFAVAVVCACVGGSLDVVGRGFITLSD